MIHDDHDDDDDDHDDHDDEWRIMNDEWCLDDPKTLPSVVLDIWHKIWLAKVFFFRISMIHWKAKNKMSRSFVLVVW